MRSEVGEQPVPSGEELFAQLARRVPSSAGFYFDGPNRIIVNLADTREQVGAATAIRDFLNAGLIAVAEPNAIQIGVRKVQRTFWQLARIRNVIADARLSPDEDWELLDLDEHANVVRVGHAVGRKFNVERAVRAATRAFLSDTASVVFSNVEPSRPTVSSSSFGWTGLAESADTIVGGLGVGRFAPSPVQWACSIGFTAVHPTFGQAFMTASHCRGLASEGGDPQQIWAIDGHEAFQVWNGTAAGTEVADPPPWGCGIDQLCRRSDAALYQLDGSRQLSVGLIAKPSGLGNFNADPTDPYFVIVGWSNGTWGQTVYKVGFATGWTAGYISSTCVDFNLTGWSLNGANRKVRCTNLSTNANIEGDSGGPVFLPIGGRFVKLSGIVSGNKDGQTSWSTMSQIQLDFGSSLQVSRPASLASPVIAGSIVGGAPKVSWSAVPGASAYHVYYSTGSSFSHIGEFTGLSYQDSWPVTSVHTSAPAAPWVAYYVVASSPGNTSLNSSTIWFKRPAAIAATIIGAYQVEPYDTCQWSASATGGTGSYSYSWKVNGQSVGGNSSELVYASGGSPFTLDVIVTDGFSMQGSASTNVNVSSGVGSCGF